MGDLSASSQPVPTLAASPAGNIVVRARSGEAVARVRTGLLLPQRLPFERWVDIGMQLSAASTSAAWCLGDWLAFGEKAYTSRYRKAIELTALDYQTLRNYAWVAKRFTMPRRRDTLSFGHHAEVAARPEAEQDFWLRKAEYHHWPVKHLRCQLRTSLAERSAEPPDQPSRVQGQDHDQGGWTIVRLRITSGQFAACQAAADKANLTVQDWATLALEHASTTPIALRPNRDRTPTVISRNPGSVGDVVGTPDQAHRKRSIIGPAPYIAADGNGGI